MANRFVEKRRAQAREVVADRLEPGEEIEILLFCVTRPYPWLGVLLTSFVVLFQRSWYVLLTDRRVFVVALNRWSGRPTGVEWDEPRAGVRVERYRRGLLMGKLYVRRVVDGRVLKLQFNFHFRSDALAIKSALDG